MQQLQLSEATAAQRRIFFHAVDSTDGLTAETGLTGTGWFSKNGATPAASTGSISELNATNMPGRYYIEATATELNAVGIIEFRYKAAACAEVIARAQVVPFDPYDAVRMGLTALPNAAAEAAGGLYTRGTGAGQINQQTNGQIDSNVERLRNAVVNILVSGRMDASVGAMAANVIAAAAIAADAITAAKVAADVHAEAADAVWDEDIVAAHGAASAAGLLLRALGGTISARTNNATLNALLGISDVASQDLAEQLLRTETFAELTTVIGPTPTVGEMLMWAMMSLRNEATDDGTIVTISNNAGVVIAKATISNVAGTATRLEFVAGP